MMNRVRANETENYPKYEMALTSLSLFLGKQGEEGLRWRFAYDNVNYRKLIKAKEVKELAGCSEAVTQSNFLLLLASSCPLIRALSSSVPESARQLYLSLSLSSADIKLDSDLAR